MSLSTSDHAVEAQLRTLSKFESRSSYESKLEASEDKPDLIKLELDIARLRSRLARTSPNTLEHADLVFTIADQEKQLKRLEARKITAGWPRARKLKYSAAAIAVVALIAGIIVIAVLVSTHRRSAVMSMSPSPSETAPLPSDIPGGVLGGNLQ